MNINKVVLSFLLLITLVCFSSCNTYKDGVYMEMASEFPTSGWKELVEITVENGKIVNINWDAIYKDDSIPIRKKQYSKSGLYGMLAAGAGDEWYDQAVATEDFVLENGIDALNINKDGQPDAIASCTIHVTEFEALYLKCLEKAKK